MKNIIFVFLAFLNSVLAEELSVQATQNFPAMLNKTGATTQTILATKEKPLTIKILGDRGSMYHISIESYGKSYLISKQWGDKLLNLNNARQANQLVGKVEAATQVSIPCLSHMPTTNIAPGKTDRLTDNNVPVASKADFARHREKLYFDRYYYCKHFLEYEKVFLTAGADIRALKQALVYYIRNPKPYTKREIAVRDYSKNSKSPTVIIVNLEEGSARVVAKGEKLNEQECKDYESKNVRPFVKDQTLLYRYVPQCRQQMKRVTDQIPSWEQSCNRTPYPAQRPGTTLGPLNDRSFDMRFKTLKFERSF